MPSSDPIKIKEQRAKWREKNRDKIRQADRLFYIENRERLLEAKKVAYAEGRLRPTKPNKARNDKLYRKRRAERDPAYKLYLLLRSRNYKALKGLNKSKRSQELLGATWEQAREHLESLFQPGMTWENHGLWEIDHIKPVSSFDLTKVEEQRIAFNYKNLQPLWKEDNRRKGAS